MFLSHQTIEKYIDEDKNIKKGTLGWPKDPGLTDASRAKPDPEHRLFAPQAMREAARSLTFPDFGCGDWNGRRNSESETRNCEKRRRARQGFQLFDDRYHEPERPDVEIRHFPVVSRLSSRPPCSRSGTLRSHSPNSAS